MTFSTGHRAEARLEAFADAIEQSPPSRILTEDGGPSTELLEFCEKTSCSLDWVFFGDLRPTFRMLCEFTRRYGREGL